jgi:hypothetical protein
LLAALPLSLSLVGCDWYTVHAYAPRFRGANKAQLPQPAIVTPVLDCSRSDTPNVDARRSAALVIGAGLWHAMHLPGEANVTSNRVICDMIATTYGSHRDRWQLSPAQAHDLGTLLASVPGGHQALVVPFYTMMDDAHAQTAAVHDSTGAYVGSYETGVVNRWETANVMYGVVVLSPADGFVWGVENGCGPTIGTRVGYDVRCGDASYSHFDEATHATLIDFPWQIVGLSNPPDATAEIDVSHVPSARRAAAAAATVAPAAAPPAAMSAPVDAAASAPAMAPPVKPDKPAVYKHNAQLDVDAELVMVTESAPESCKQLARANCTKQMGDVDMKLVCDGAIRDVNLLAQRANADRTCKRQLDRLHR